jgi:uncharacterized OB-fold protein
MGIRPRTARAKKIKARRCPKCGRKLNNQLRRCKACAKQVLRLV